MHQIREEALDVVPGGNLLFLDDRLRLHPKATAGIGYDSNPFGRSADADGDIFAAGTVGCEARAAPAELLDVRADAELSLKRYRRSEGANLDGYDTGLRMKLSDDRLRLDAGVRTRELSEPLRETGSPLRRREEAALAAVAVNGARSDARLRLEAGAVDYRQDSLEFDRTERDARNLAGSLEVGWDPRLRPFDRIALGVRLERCVYPEGRYQDNTRIMPYLRSGIATGDRSYLAATAGWQQRSYADPFAGDPAFDDASVSGLVGDLAWSWDWEARSRVFASVGHSFTDGIDSNALSEIEVRAVSMTRLAWETNLFVTGRFRELRDSGQAAGAGEHRRRISDIEITFEKVLTQGVFCRISQQTTLRRSNRDDTFERYIVWVEFGIVL